MEFIEVSLSEGCRVLRTAKTKPLPSLVPREINKKEYLDPLVEPETITNYI